MKRLLIPIAVVLMLGLGLVVRLKDLSAPLADWHSWRQADTASVAREYVKHGIDLLHPTYQDVSAIPSGKANPSGYRMVEFPLVNALVASIAPHLSTLPIHVVYRLINIFFSLISAWCIYLLVRRLESPFTGLLAMGAFLFIPYNIFYSRTVLPEVAMVTFSLAALYAGTRWFDKHAIIDLVGTAIFAAIALLIKPVAAFLIFPLIPYAIQQNSLKKLINLPNLILAAIAVIPLILWRQWIQQYPEGIPASAWLLNGNGIRFKGAFFQWLFADRLGRLILGFWGLIPFAAGLLAKKKSNLFFWLTVSSLAYLCVFATGNVQHDYYQIPIIPIVAILIAYGIQFIRHLDVSVFAKYGLITISIAFSVAFSWYHVRGLYQINNPAIVEAGQAIDKLAPEDALVIAPYDGDTAFLYQTNRRGWPIGGDIDQKIAAGAGYYVTTAMNAEAKQLQLIYPTVASTSAYTIIELRGSPSK